MGKLKVYFYNLGLAIDQLLNAILGGDCDQSLSARLGYAMKNNPYSIVKFFAYCNDKLYEILFRVNNHSVDAIEPEEKNKYETWKWYKGD